MWHARDGTAIGAAEPSRAAVPVANRSVRPPVASRIRPRRRTVVAASVSAVAALAASVIGVRSAAAADGLAVVNARTDAYPTVSLLVDAPPDAPDVSAGLAVTEDGAPVAATVERLFGPDLEVVVAVDTSTAMGPGPLGQVRTAVRRLVERMPAPARVGLVRFGGDATVVARPTADRDAVVAAVGRLTAGGATRLYPGVAAARDAFTPAARQRVIVLVAAGGDQGGALTIDEAAASVAGSYLEVVSLENPATSPLALARLAIDGRGTVAAVADPDGLEGTMGTLADALLGRYLVTYRSAGGGTVSVRVSSPVGAVTSRLELPGGGAAGAAAAPGAAPDPSALGPAVPVAPVPPVLPVTPPAGAAVPSAPPVGEAGAVAAPAPATLAPAAPALPALPVDPAATTAVTTAAPAATDATDAEEAPTSSDGGGVGALVWTVGVLAAVAALALVVLRVRRTHTASRHERASVDGAARLRRVHDLVDADDAPDGAGVERDGPVEDGVDDALEGVPASAAHEPEPEERPAYDYARYSTLAGPLAEVIDGGIFDRDRDEADVEPYRVRFEPALPSRQRAVVLPFLAVNMVVAVGFYVWLIQPSHLPRPAHRGVVIEVLAYLMLAGIVVIEGMRLVSSFALSWWAWRAHDPVPVRPERGLRVAFTTTIVPSKEPLAVVRRTLEAARQIRHDGVLDVWILDEGNDPEVRAMCRELGVRHFTRHQMPKWNRAAGRFRARTKHGNHNAWLWNHGRHYDVEISVDPDHVPLPNICERLLGYFRDPDVAFVCGPQVYGNYTSFLTRAAESQAYLFQSVIQRAANRDACGMFVGTNHAYRISAWRQIGGFQDSITEDMATSFAVHGATNPATGAAWKSVYTPDVIAVGEGPATWTDFFSQQLRWARGTDEVLVRGGLRRFRRLSWPRRLHYALLCSYYPFVAIGWMLGLALSAAYVVTGATGLHLTDLRSWFTLYADLAIVQISLYFWLRRLNVSPHEPEGSAGVAGMFVSMLATPVYVAALVGAVLRRPLGFVVTPKGDRATLDGPETFRMHLRWAAASLVVIAAAFLGGRALWAALLAPCICLSVSLTPVAFWLTERRRARRAERAARGAPTPIPTTVAEPENPVLAEITA